MRSRWLGGLLAATVCLAGCASATVSSVPEQNNPTNIARPTTAPTSARSSTPSAGAPLTVLLSGEMLWQDPIWLGAEKDAAGTGAEFDFAPLLAGIKPTIAAASLAVCHQEVPIAAPGGPYLGFPSYSVPPQIVPAIKDAGFDVCTLNSERALDQGLPGLDRTLVGFRSGGLITVGAYRTQAESRQSAIVAAQGVRIAFISGTESRGAARGTAENGWAVAMLNADDMIQRAKAARAAGAQIVIAAMHAGQEYTTAPTEQQRAVAAKLAAAAEIDVIYGHHAHTVQPAVKVNGKWVFYGLGNLLAQPAAERVGGYESILVRLTFAPKQGGGFVVSKAEYLPTITSQYSPGNPARVHLTKQALASGGDSKVLTASLERVRSAVANPGGLTEA